MLSQTGEYALRAMVHLAQAEEEGARIQADEVAEALQIPRNYLSKILHTLGRKGLLASTRGPGGGFRLAVPPAELPLARIVEIFDPQLLAEDQRCLMGREVCSDADACPAHEHWKKVSREVRAFFSRTSLATLAGGSGPDD
jgi:Rrf2 family transcriptional regulator, iron-sulfur cluster assembly transcription factor